MTLVGRTAAARELSGYDMPDIAQGSLSMWLSARSPTYYSLDGSSNVDTAFDLSPAGQNATQATADDRPPLVTHNGNTWFDFSQGNDYLTTLTGPAILSNVPIITMSRTIVAVIYLPYSSHTSARRVFIESYDEYHAGSLEINASNEAACSTNDGGVITIEDTSTFPLQTIQVVAQRISANDLMTLWVGGSQVASASVGIFTIAGENIRGYQIGTYRDANSRWFDGYLGELVVFDRSLSDDELAAARDVLLQRWA